MHSHADHGIHEYANEEIAGRIARQLTYRVPIQERGLPLDHLL